MLDEKKFEEIVSKLNEDSFPMHMIKSIILILHHLFFAGGGAYVTVAVLLITWLNIGVIGVMSMISLILTTYFLGGRLKGD